MPPKVRAQVNGIGPQLGLVGLLVVLNAAFAGLEISPVPRDEPRDRAPSFESQLVKRRQRRLRGVEEMVISLMARRLITGEVQAHLAEVHGISVSRETISKVTDAIFGRDGRLVESAARAGLCRGVHRRDRGQDS